jgi:hypothetical protein
MHRYESLISHGSLAPQFAPASFDRIASTCRMLTSRFTPSTSIFRREIVNWITRSVVSEPPPFS